MSYTHDEATIAFRLPADRNLRKTQTINISLENPDRMAEERKVKQEAIRRYMHYTFEVYEKVYEPLTCDEAFTVPPVHKLRHPLIFYLGHTATFYLNKLTLAGLTSRINPKYEETFAVGVDEMSWDDLNEAHYDWPAVADVYKYRRLVRQRLDDLFNKYTLPLPLTFENSTTDADHTFFWGIMMGIEHERIHLETATVHVRELPMKYVRRVPYWDPCTEEASDVPATNDLVEFQGGKVRVGRPMDSEVYGWDCDYASDVTVTVASFKASERLVSNAEFYEFVKAGGYATREFWDEEGWSWVTWKQPQHPWFWVRKEGGGEHEYLLRQQCTEVEMKWSWPCEVNNLEATAYCAWLSKKLGKTLRLPTETEWLHMHDVCLGSSQDQHKWKVAPGNLNLEHYCSSCPVNMFKQGKLYDLVGNVWQHCETPVYPYQGYKVHPLYDDFSMPTFDGRHRCMKGGTWISTGNEATRDARYAFRRHFFQYIGIRFIEGPAVDEMRHMKNVLGLDPPVDLAAHRAYSALPAHSDVSPKEVYGKVLAEMAVDAFKSHAKGRTPTRAMDVLCGAGRASYELSLAFQSVIGVDFSARMLQPAYAMKERGHASYSAISDAATEERKAVVAHADNHPWNDRREDVTFYQSDPANLHAHLKDFDLILAFDIMNQNTSYNPRLVPAHLLSRLLTGGIIVAAEPKKKLTANALTADEYTAVLKDAGAELVQSPVTVTLYLADTENEGRMVEFEVFAMRKL